MKLCIFGSDNKEKKHAHNWTNTDRESQDFVHNDLPRCWKTFYRLHWILMALFKGVWPEAFDISRWERISRCGVCHNLCSWISKDDWSLDQVFNCDETGFYYRLLPQKTLVCTFEKMVMVVKKQKIESQWMPVPMLQDQSSFVFFLLESLLIHDVLMVWIWVHFQ